ncbi:MAG TPA: S-adenosylmethionine decarboxylase [Gemmatimonas sp.]|nr:S-adenosylmethionine decarboxylase [Gemmatimonas sp.]
MQQQSGTAGGGPPAGAVVHLVAELTGVATSCLHDTDLLGGLLIAAAGAAGLHAATTPMLRSTHPRGVDGILLLAGGHAAVHAQADRNTLLIDFVAPVPVDLARALEVFTRRLGPAGVAAERIVRVGIVP